MSGHKKLPTIIRLSLLASSLLAQSIIGANTLVASATEQTAAVAPPCKTWIKPLGKPLAALVCVHGLGLNSSAYEDFGLRASRQGIAVYALDVRGFGSWIKSKGAENVNFDDCLNDVKLTLEAVRKSNPNVPVFLLGESMGGAIALRVASLYPELLDGVISSVPAGERFQQGKTDLQVAAHFLTGPRRKFNIGKTIVNQVTQNEDLKNEWTSDPLARLDLSAKELLQFQVFMNGNHDCVKKLVKLPVLMVQGNNDRLVKPDESFDLFRQIASPDKVFLAVPSEHLIFEQSQSQDPWQREQNMRLVAIWMLTKVFGHDLHNADIMASFMRTPAPALTQVASQTKAVESLPKEAAAEAASFAKDKPAALLFYTKWCEGADHVAKLMEEAQGQWGNRVNLVTIDSDSKEGKETAKRFAVGAIPSIYFLKTGGDLSSVMVGQAKFPNFIKQLAQAIIDSDK
ncbi:MAG: Phospholipase YtpA [bacterium ADurb.Bin425]|nr:MAG: Phospholipase YtpA [bacterium ADurb.Bin425]